MVSKSSDFPAWFFHATHGKKLVPNAEGFAALGEGWFDHPAKCGAPPVEASSGSDVTMPQGTNDKTAAADTGVAASEQAEADAIYKSSIASIVEKLENASAEVLAKVKRFEEANPNPKYPGGRKGVLQAVDEALAKLAG